MAKRTWDPDVLAGEIAGKIDEYLTGSADGKSLSAWAVQQLVEHEFSSSQLMLDVALSALVSLSSEDPEFDTSTDELGTIRSTLLGECDYPILLRWIPKSEVESVRQSRRSQTR